MDTQTSLLPSVFLTSVNNQASLSARLKQWQEANAFDLAKNQLFTPEAQVEYDQLIQELSLCFIAFVGCKIVASKLPDNQVAFSQLADSDESKLGKWCLWHISPRYIELIVERLNSLRTQPFNADSPFDLPTPFNKFDLVVFKIPQMMMGEDRRQLSWVCSENIAQLRNCSFPEDRLMLTALAANVSCADTSEEFTKILESELSDITADTVIEFAECYGIDVNQDGKLDLSKGEKSILNVMLKLLKEEYSCGLYHLASYVVSVLVNYQLESCKTDNCTSLRLALGRAMQALGFPRNSEAFMAKSLAKATKTGYQKALDEIYRSQSGLANRKDKNDHSLDWDALEKRYQFLANPSEQEEQDQATKQYVDAGSQDSSSKSLSTTDEILSNAQPAKQHLSPVGSTGQGSFSHNERTKPERTPSATPDLSDLEQAAHTVHTDQVVPAASSDQTEQTKQDVHGELSGQLGQSEQTKQDAQGELIEQANQSESDQQAETLLRFSERELATMREFIGNLAASHEVYAQSYHNLCFIDWNDKLELLFVGNSKTKKKLKLSQRLFDLFDEIEQQEIAQKGRENVTPLLDVQDVQAIELTDTSRTKLTDEDRAVIESFLNEHRSELERNPKICAEVEKLSCKTDIECTDFVIGLSQMLLSLCSDQHDIERIELNLDGIKHPEDFLRKRNFNLCTFFSIMYSPLLKKLCTNFPYQFDVTIGNFKDLPINPLLDLNEFLKQCCAQLDKRQSELKCYGVGKTALSLDFKVTVTLKSNQGRTKVNSNTGKLTWSMDANSVGLLLKHDLELIDQAKTPFQCVFGRNLTSAHGRINSLDLNDLSTFISDVALQYGSFIADDSKKRKDNLNLKARRSDSMQGYQVISESAQELSLDQLFIAKCQEQGKAKTGSFSFVIQNTQVDTTELQEEFKRLCEQYVQTVGLMQKGELTLELASDLMHKYAQMQLHILEIPADGGLCSELLSLVQSIGLAYEYQERDTHGEEFAVATPYHIQSIYNHMLRLERLYGLVGKMLSQRLFIDKRNVVFKALHDMQSSLCGPEVVAPRNSDHVQVLQAIQACNGYTLYQSVELTPDVSQINTLGRYDMLYFERKAFFQDDNDQLKRAIEFMGRYVRNHPECDDPFNVVLYNCDKLELLPELCDKLNSSSLVKDAKLNLYVANNSPRTLSFSNQNLEDKQRSNSNDFGLQEETPKINAVLFNHIEEVSNLHDQYGLRRALNFDNTQDNFALRACPFHVGLVFHVCDSQAKFNFERYELPFIQDETELFHSQTNFARYQQESNCSNLFLVSPEQNIYGMVYLHALYFTQSKERPQPETLKTMRQVLEQKQHELSTQDLSEHAQSMFCQPQTLLTPVPNYRLRVDENTPAGNMLTYIHNQAEEVISFDALLTRSQFYRLGINIVQYQQAVNGNTNTFVSTRFGLDQSCTYLRTLLQNMRTEGSDEQLQKIFDSALDLSGGLILHSQIAPIYTNEMLGLVLSKHLAQVVIAHLNHPEHIEAYIKGHGLESESSAMQVISQQQSSQGLKIENADRTPRPQVIHYDTAFFLLDEYRSWFGSSTGEIADILGLNVCVQDNNRYLLRIVIVESKFCQDNPKAVANKSVKQTKATAETFFAIFSHDNAMCTIDRQLKMSQLTSMLSHHKMMENADGYLQLLQALQAGKCDISITAMSCVYAYGNNNKQEDLTLKTFDYGSTEHNTLPLKPQAMQLIFNGELAQRMLHEFLQESACSSSSSESNSATGLGLEIFSSGELMLGKRAYRDFLERQMVVQLDAKPDAAFARKTDDIPFELRLLSSAALRKDSLSAAESSSGSDEVATNHSAELNRAEANCQLDDQSSSTSPLVQHDEANLEQTKAINQTTSVQTEPSQNEIESHGSGAVSSESPKLGGESKEVRSHEAHVEPDFKEQLAKVKEELKLRAQQTAEKELAMHSSVQPQRPKSALELLRKFNISADFAPAEAKQELNLVEAGDLSSEERQELQGFFERHETFAQLLHTVPDTYKDEIRQRMAWAERKQLEMCKAFKSCGLNPMVESCHLTPNGAVFRFKGNENFECRSIERKRDYFLTTFGIDIDKVRPVAGAVELSLHNTERTRVAIPYLSLFKQRTFNFEKVVVGQDQGQNPKQSQTPNQGQGQGQDQSPSRIELGFNSKFLLGLQESNGDLAYLDLQYAAPHTLIAGGTGSGKSNVLNILLLDIVLTNRPQDVNLTLMDPKNGAEFGIFKNLPHVSQMVYTKEQATEVFNELVDEMRQRYALFNGMAHKLGDFAKINDLPSYNKQVPQEDRLPRKIVVIDEFADWFGDSDFKQRTLTSIKLLGAQARAAGIHLILATQRPDKDVVDVQLRSNLGNQIALKTKDDKNSVIILGQSISKSYDASKLLGKGHMICNFEGNDVFYAQAAFIDNELLGRVVEAIYCSY